MNFLKKITGSLLAASLFALLLAPAALAQTSLDDIKSKLEGEGIAVIDYSGPEGQWGSLPKEWISYLSGTYTSLSNLAEDLEDHYIGSGSITDYKRQLAIAVAEKSRLTKAEEIEEKDGVITLLELALESKQEDAKDDIANIVAGSLLNKDEGINLIFNEVDFYFNYSKWGRLPLRIIGLLEESGLNNLQDLLDLDDDPDLLFTAPQEYLRTIGELSSTDIELIMDSLAILSATGEQQIDQVTRAVANTIKNIIAGIAVIWIVIAGARLIFAQGDENQITEQKRAIIWGIVGLVAILLVDRGIDVLYGPAGAPRAELTPDQGFTTEVYGVVTFIKALIGTIAIAFIVISGVRMLGAAGDEQEITKQKQAILWVGMGLILIAIDQVIVENVFIIPTQQSDQIRTSNIVSVVNTVSSIFQFILGFVGLIAFGALVYGAATMITNYGNDEMVEKSKKIIRNALIGIMVIISAYTIVATLVVFR